MAKGDARVKISIDDQFSAGIKKIQQALVRAQAVFQKTQLKIQVDNKSALGKIDFLKKNKLQQLVDAFKSTTVKVDLSTKSARGKIDFLKKDKLQQLKEAYEGQAIKVTFDASGGLATVNNAIKTISDKGRALPKIKVEIDPVDPKKLEDLKAAATAIRSITAAPKRASKAPNVNKTLKKLEEFIPKLAEFSKAITASMAEVNAALRTLDPSKLKELAGILKTAKKNADRIIQSLKTLGGAAKIVSQAEFELEKATKRANKEKEEQAKKAKKSSASLKLLKNGLIGVIGKIPVLRIGLKALGQGFGKITGPTLVTRLRQIRFAFVDIGSILKTAFRFSPFGQLILQLGEALRLATDLELRTAQIATLLQGEGGAGNVAVGFDFTDPTTREAALRKLQSEIRNVAAESGQDFQSAFQAAYDAISSGVPATRLIEFLRTANKLAIGGVTDLGTATKLLVSVFQTTGRDFDKLESQTDSLFTTIRLGRTTADQLAGALGRVLPVASRLNIDLDELGGALAALTAGGLSTAEAVTALRNFLQKIQLPTQRSADLAEELGIQLDVTGLRKSGSLLEYLKDLASAAGDSNRALAILFPRIRAQIALQSLLRGGGTATLERFIDPFAEKAGAANTAVEIISDTVDFQIKKLRATFFDFRVELIQEFLPAIAEFVAGALEPLELIVDSLRSTNAAADRARLAISKSELPEEEKASRLQQIDALQIRQRGTNLKRVGDLILDVITAGAEVIKSAIVTSARALGFDVFSVSGTLGETLGFFIDVLANTLTDVFLFLVSQIPGFEKFTPRAEQRPLTEREADRDIKFIADQLRRGGTLDVDRIDSIANDIFEKSLFLGGGVPVSPTFRDRPDLNRALETLSSGPFNTRLDAISSLELSLEVLTSSLDKLSDANATRAQRFDDPFTQEPRFLQGVRESFDKLNSLLGRISSDFGVDAFNIPGFQQLAGLQNQAGFGEQLRNFGTNADLLQFERAIASLAARADILSIVQGQEAERLEKRNADVGRLEDIQDAAITRLVDAFNQLAILTNRDGGRFNDELKALLKGLQEVREAVVPTIDRSRALELGFEVQETGTQTAGLIAASGLPKNVIDALIKELNSRISAFNAEGLIGKTADEAEEIISGQVSLLSELLDTVSQIERFRGRDIADIELLLERETERLALQKEERKILDEIQRLKQADDTLSDLKVILLEEINKKLLDQKRLQAEITRELRLQNEAAASFEAARSLALSGARNVRSVDIDTISQLDPKDLRDRQLGLAGEISSLTALIDSGDLDPTQLAEVQTQLAAVRNEFAALGREIRVAEGGLDGVKAKLEELSINLPTGLQILTDAVTGLINGIAEGLTQLTVNLITDLINGTQSAGDALKQFFGNLLIQIGSAIVQAIILRTIMTALGLPVLPFNSGGPVVGRNTGGPVPGARGPDRDSVPAVLTPGEFVIQRSAVDKLGLPFLMALNGVGRAPSGFRGRTSTQVAGISPMRFNTGGRVGGMAGTAGPQPTFLLANETNMQALLQGGQNQFISFLRDNRNKF